MNQVEVFFKEKFGLTAIPAKELQGYLVYKLSEYQDSDAVRKYIHINDAEYVKYIIDGDYLLLEVV